MKKISTYQHYFISGGCPAGSCQDATINFLDNCSHEQMAMINQIFMDVILAPNMMNADGDIIKAALIEAISISSF